MSTEKRIRETWLAEENAKLKAEGDDLRATIREMESVLRAADGPMSVGRTIAEMRDLRSRLWGTLCDDIDSLKISLDALTENPSWADVIGEWASENQDSGHYACFAGFEKDVRASTFGPAYDALDIYDQIAIFAFVCDLLERQGCVRRSHPTPEVSK